MKLDSKGRLLKDQPTVIKHRDRVVDDAFLRIAEVTLIEMVMNAPEIHTPEEALAQYAKIIGARDYLTGLLNIAETPSPPPRKPSTGNLDHRL